MGIGGQSAAINSAIDEMMPSKLGAGSAAGTAPAALAVRTDRPVPAAVEDEPPPRPGPAAGR